MVTAELRISAKAVYLVCDETVASDLSFKLNSAADEID